MTTSISKLTSLGGALLLAMSLVPQDAAARRVVSAEHSETVGLQLEEALDVLVSDDICMSGCRYKSGSIDARKRVRLPGEEGRHFRWTSVKQAKDTQFFSEVFVQRSAGGAKVRAVVLSEKEDAALIGRLQKASGLAHKSLPDSVIREVQLKPTSGGLHVHMTARAEISGFLELFAGRVREGLLRSLIDLSKNF